MHPNSNNTPSVLRQLSLAIALTLPALGTSPLALAAGNQVQKFDIPAQPLADALNAFIATSDWQVGFPAGLARDVRANPVYGNYTPQQALDKLVAGKGLAVKSTGGGNVTLVKTAAPVAVAAATSAQSAETLPTMKVTATTETDNDPREAGPGRGYVVRESSIGTKLDIPLQELPQAAQVVSKQVIQDQGLTTFNDVLKNVSGWAPSSTFGEHDGNFKIRGFDAGPLRDGEPNTYGFGTSNSRDLFVNFERIEVLKGPAAVAYGASQQGDLGGVINLVSKMPQETARYQFTSQTDQYGYESPSFDATGSLNDSKTALYRFTGQYLHRGSFIDNYEQNSWGMFPTITFTNRKDTDLTLKVEYQEKRVNYYTGLPAYGTVFGPKLNYPIGRNFGESSSPVHTEPNLVTTATLNHKFNDDWSIKTVFRYFRGESKYEGTQSPTYLNSDGTFGGLDDARTLQRNYLFYNEIDRDLLGDVQLHGRTLLLGTEHKLLLGVQHLNYEGDTDVGIGSINSIDLFNPQYGAKPQDLALFPHYNDKSQYTGIYFQDHLALTPKLKFLLGTRYNIIYDNIDPGDPNYATNRTLTEPTPSVGVTYALTDSINVYSSYARGIRPTFGVFRPGVNPQPEQSRMFEAGAKFDFHQGLTASFALFRIEKQNNTVSDITDPGFNIQVGEVTSEGAEANAIWAPDDGGWTITGTYGYTDARVTKNTDPTFVGGHLINVPHNSGRLWSMYRFSENSSLSGFRAGAGMYAVDERQGTLPNTYVLPGYVTFDAMLGYAFKHYDVAVNLQNIGDSRIYETTGSYNEGIFPGAPFTAVLSLKTTW